jgi:hypothetical protein
MLRTLLIAIAALIVALPLRAQEKKPSLADLNWLTGSWLEKRDGVETEEHWIAPKGGLMLGVNRTTRTGGRTSHEFLRIAEREGGAIAYLAQPAGAAITVFPLKELKDKHVVFENLKHDFPQRISYRLDEQGRLVARIEGKVDGAARSQEWTWERVK